MNLSFQLPAEHVSAAPSGCCAFKGLWFADTERTHHGKASIPLCLAEPLDGAGLSLTAPLLFLHVLQTTKREPFADLICSL